MKSNYHSHTHFCDGRVTMEEILKSAIAAGFQNWGFTPHAPIEIESPCNMKKEDVPAYLQEIERLRNKYPDIKIYAGMEVDFLDEGRGPSSFEVEGYGLDYVIGSIHFIPNQVGEFHDVDGSPERFKKCLKEHFNDDLEFVVNSFWKQTDKMIECGGFDIIGHIDKISLNASYVDPEIENKDYYKILANKTIDKAIRSGKAIEINTKHWEKYRLFFPNPCYWDRILKSGVIMPINTDAHYSEKVESGREDAIKELKFRGLYKSENHDFTKNRDKEPKY